MILHQISRTLESFNPPERFKIKEEEIISCVDGIQELSYERKTFKSPVGERLLLIGNYTQNDKIVFKYTFIDGKIRISYDGKLNDEIIVATNKFAECLEAYLFLDINMELPKSRISDAYQNLNISTNK